MDIYNYTADEELVPLDYDDTVPYEEQVSSLPDTETGGRSLAGRIGVNKLYLLSESGLGSTNGNLGKVRVVPGLVNIWVA